MESVWKKQQETRVQGEDEDAKHAQDCPRLSANAHGVEGQAPQKSRQHGLLGLRSRRREARKAVKIIGPRVGFEPMTGDTAWSEVEVPFYIKEGEKPDLLKLNVYADGTGTLYIKDI